MNTKSDNKRFNFIFLLILILIAVGSRFLIAYAKNISPSSRGYWILGSMAIFLFPFGYIYGRNYARKDDLGKISRFFGYASVFGFAIRFCFGKQISILDGILGGFLCGFCIGMLVQKKSVKKYGDSIEADQYCNPTSSERLHPAYIEYYRSLDIETKRYIGRRRLYEGLLIPVSVIISMSIAFPDYYGALIRHIYHHRDAVFFITYDSIMIVAQLSIILGFIFWKLILRYLPPSSENIKNAWEEYVRLRDKIKCPPQLKKAGCIFGYMILVASVITLLLYTDYYVKVTNNGIAVNNFWTIGEKFYGWDAVRYVDAENVCCHSKDGEQYYIPSERIEFSDGSKLELSRDNVRSSKTIKNAVSYIASHVGKTVDFTRKLEK